MVASGRNTVSTITLRSCKGIMYSFFFVTYSATGCTRSPRAIHDRLFEVPLASKKRLYKSRMMDEGIGLTVHSQRTCL